MNTHEALGLLARYTRYLQEKELSPTTIAKYTADIQNFLEHTDATEVGKTALLAYRDALLRAHKASTVNSYLISINQYFRWLGRERDTVKTMRIQRRVVLENVLTRAEYERLLAQAQRTAHRRDYLLLRTLAGTGIRVSELHAITREAAQNRTVDLFCKGKYRKIFIPEELACELLDYCAKQQIDSGVVFQGKAAGTPLHTASVWKIVKRTAARCGVPLAKAYPHSLRHLFAKTYMSKVGNIFELADILGHASVETTRLYARASCKETWDSINTLGL